jgi:hypothetical protein
LQVWVFGVFVVGGGHARLPGGDCFFVGCGNVRISKAGGFYPGAPETNQPQRVYNKKDSIN